MERKKRIEVPGLGQRDAVEVGFRSTGEYWNEYLLDDGSVLRFKSVVAEVVRVEDVFDAEGNPTYMVKSSQIMNVSAPDDLRRK